MSVFNEKEQRKVFLNVVRENLLGPGSFQDIYLCGDDFTDEIIARNPVEQYYTGIIFPEKPESEDPVKEMEEDEEPEGLNLADEASDYSENDEDVEEDETGSYQPDPTWLNRYYPSYSGLIFCVSSEAESINVNFNYAKYSSVANVEEVKVKLGNDEQQFTENKEKLEAVLNKFIQLDCYSIFEHGVVDTLDTFLNYSQDDETIFITERPKLSFLLNDEIKQRPYERKDISSLYKRFKELAEDEEQYSYEYVMVKLLFLFEKAYFRREQHEINFDLNISDEITSDEKRSIEGCAEVSYRYKTFTRTRNGTTKKFVKLLIENNNPWFAKKDDGDSTGRGWKLRSFFQPEICIRSESFTDYKDLIDNAVDEENTTNEYLYREEKSYGKGIGCSVQWDDEDNVTEIRTSYMPEAYVRDFSNEPDERLEENRDVLKLKNISSWSSWDDDKILDELESFIQKFERWKSSQNDEARQEEQFENIFSDILDNQDLQLSRLIENLEYLRDKKNKALESFRIANTAMYLQMLIARSPIFRKNRELTDFDAHHFNYLGYFKELDFIGANEKYEPSYRPFQLAFLLMNVKSVFEQDDAYRQDVDLIWFPTGGGKTEAYLALTALTIIARRRQHKDTESKGVTVIMRYTLRLLTAQQFERATYLICALEFLRNNDQTLKLGTERISIGMWVGGDTTPNQTARLRVAERNKWAKFITEAVNADVGNELSILQNKNPFPIAYCPWCGCKLLTVSEGPMVGYSRTGELKCQNSHCYFSGNNTLPVYYIDDMIYQRQPTLLFGTVDKFANLNKKEGHKLFNSKPSDTGLPPDLIIQDELHLLSGPLGSMVGLFESLIELMASVKGRKPKIIASTATTRNTKFLVKQLYGRNVRIFPAPGIRYSDNFFSHVDRTSKKRLHVGVIPIGHTAAMTEIKLVALMIIAKIKLFSEFLTEVARVDDLNDIRSVLETVLEEERLRSELDDFWTPVLFYNSLKDLGRTKSRIPQEIYEAIRALMNFTDFPGSLSFIISNFYNRVKEFTSRENSSKIKSLLTKAESEIILGEYDGRIVVQEGMDLIMASNMISVGIDIKRLNIMLFAGQPRSVSEYIQSSSRVARDRKGIVFNLLNSNRIREMSLFENFTAFHNVYYKYVEPLSATPYTEATMSRLMNNILVSYVRHITDNAATNIRNVNIEPLVEFLQNRCTDDVQRNYIRNRFYELFNKWAELADDGIVVDYEYFQHNDDEDFQLMKSLRTIDPDCFARIQSLHYK